MIKLWPDGFSINDLSFSNKQLESIVERNYCYAHDRSIGYRYYPWLYWTTELYSFGKCYRELMGFPKFLPLPFYGDHGVCLNSYFEPHEAKSKCKHHVTWFDERYNSLCSDDSHNKSIIHMPHPWVKYRHMKDIQLDSDRKGTLVFYAHTNNGIEMVDYDDDDYFAKLSRLPDEFHPITICIHQHDIKKGTHLKLRKYGLSIITFGLTSSIYFVDRFYDVVTKFKYATSSFGGSELYYCHELGLKYFILGKEPNLVNISHIAKPKGSLSENKCYLAKKTDNLKRELFSYDNLNGSDLEKDNLVSHILGMDVIDKFSYLDFKRKLYRSLISEYPNYIGLLMKKALQRIVKIASN